MGIQVSTEVLKTWSAEKLHQRTSTIHKKKSDPLISVTPEG